MISSVLQSGVQGVKQNLQGMEKAATEIAKVGQPAEESGELRTVDDVVESIVDLKLYENGVKASAKVIKSADETLGTLLDIKA
ncbi:MULTISPECIES: flagellar biosynthesis protein FlgE [unclassified Hahella]|uniref:flagellar biosynthesis protein FlgE n=1 Tax=unclassified Hahella TaxID=2624107 RepID=UPI001C1F1E44|nr:MULTISPECIES: flagellar biosynthesis protein FlgE [unclassified Hahella]MBU6950033.1 flagellar biosynthesis protein FlgE [Hahella sp. HN01]MDG9671101.1 flagellar biosynthesis protein FlgE [Hahella sp. CR1]